MADQNVKFPYIQCRYYCIATCQDFQFPQFSTTQESGTILLPESKASCLSQAKKVPRNPFQTDRMVYSLYRSDLLVLAIPFQALTGPIFSYLWNPFPTSYTDFRLGIPRFRVHFRPQAPHYQLELQVASWRSITGLQCYRAPKL